MASYAACTLSTPQASYGGGGGGGAAAAPQPLMPYRYGYAVQDDIGNDFNQQEQSDGQVVGFLSFGTFW
jgi:hypothetical protein